MAKKTSNRQEQPVAGTASNPQAAEATPGTQDHASLEPGPFRYWDYPEPGPAALAMLLASDLREQLQALLEDGDAEAVEEWLASAEVPEGVKEVVRRGLRGQDAYDAVEAASLSWEDRTGTGTTCVVRRQGGRLVYEVWQDGMQLAERESDRELEGRELLKLMLGGVFEIDAAQPTVSFVENLPEVVAFEATSDFHDDLPGEAEVDLWKSLAAGVVENQDLAGRDFSGVDHPFQGG